MCSDHVGLIVHTTTVLCVTVFHHRHHKHFYRGLNNVNNNVFIFRELSLMCAAYKRQKIHDAFHAKWPGKIEAKLSRKQEGDIWRKHA